MITRNPPTPLLHHLHLHHHNPKTLLPTTTHLLLAPPNTRLAHSPSHQTSYPPTPPPTPFVPNPLTFLTLIGRSLSLHAPKFPTWSSLFNTTSAQLRALGVEPARQRRYLIWWRDRYRRGVVGVGGDLKFIEEGKGEDGGEGERVGWVRVVDVEVPGTAAEGEEEEGKGVKRMRRMVVNVESTAAEGEDVLGEKNIVMSAADGLKPVAGMKVKGARQIVGPFVQPVKGTGGSVARIKVQEGMWEVKRGEKVDGGERRKKMVRRKRVLEERRKERKT